MNYTIRNALGPKDLEALEKIDGSNEFEWKMREGAFNFRKKLFDDFKNNPDPHVRVWAFECLLTENLLDFPEFPVLAECHTALLQTNAKLEGIKDALNDINTSLQER